MRSLRQQFDHCKHFTGIGSDENGKRIGGSMRGNCKAMVNYDDVCKPGNRWICLPCLKIFGDSVPNNGIAPTCHKREMKTDAELDQEVKEHKELTDRLFSRVSIARKAIVEHSKFSRPAQEGLDIYGPMKCPICGGRLDYRISSYNGHIRANCQTPDCVSWME